MRGPSNDPFWSIQEREKHEEQQLRSQIEEIQARIEVARRVAALQHATGFSDFVGALRSLRDKRLSELVGDERRTNDGIRELRGSVKALDEILGILTREAVSADLAEQLATRQNLLDEALKRRPIPKPENAEAT